MLNTSKLLVSFVLLFAVIFGEDLCTSEEYDKYLEKYSAKCGDDCAEYKK